MEIKEWIKSGESVKTSSEEKETEKAIESGQIPSKPESHFAIEEEIKRRWSMILQERNKDIKGVAETVAKQEDYLRKTLSDQDILNIESKFKLSSTEEQQTEAALLEETIEEAKRG